jgi:hypothetical protein
VPAERLVVAALAERGDGVPERADARQDQLARPVDLLRLRDDLGARPHLLEALLHRAEVGHAVVEDGDHLGSRQ